MVPDLYNYLNSRLRSGSIKPSEVLLPFITISRETGCYSYRLAETLQKRIDDLSKIQWQILTKEFIVQALEELQLDKQQVAAIMRADERSHITEILKAFHTKPYRSDKTVREILKQFIQDQAQDGNVIIVGRAGAIITDHLETGLHIRLKAPLEWRIQSIMEQKKMHRRAARKYVEESDEQRAKLIYDFSQRQPAEIQWDLIVDNSRIAVDEIAEMVVNLLQKRNYL